MRLIEGVLEGERVFADDEADNEMREQIADLQRQLRDARNETAQARRESNRAMGELRRQLGPLYKALQMVFGELDAAGADEAPAASGSANPRTSAVWENWKSRLPGRPAQIIDALLLHGELNTTQIGVAVGMSRNNVPAVIFKLNKAGILTKNGDKFSLKKL